MQVYIGLLKGFHKQMKRFHVILDVLSLLVLLIKCFSRKNNICLDSAGASILVTATFERDIDRCVFSSIAALIAIGQYSTTIETVDAGWCKEITDQGATQIAQSSKSLRYLGLMRCDKVRGSSGSC